MSSPSFVRWFVVVCHQSIKAFGVVVVRRQLFARSTSCARIVERTASNTNANLSVLMAHVK